MTPFPCFASHRYTLLHPGLYSVSPVRPRKLKSKDYRHSKPEKPVIDISLIRSLLSPRSPHSKGVWESFPYEPPTPPIYVRRVPPQSAHRQPRPDPIRPRWFHPFWLGIERSFAKETRCIDFVGQVVDSCVWTKKECGELARYLCWRGAEGMSGILVRWCISGLGGFVGPCMLRSRWKLRDFAVEAFEAF
jgi:hypothetical protein